jgi:hypothetical protein
VRHSEGIFLTPDLVMDEVTRDIQGGIPWCMLFADDVVLVDESRTEVKVVETNFRGKRF